MALIDSLLLDPSPFEVWVAYRTDGQMGSGTIADPLNGAPEYGPQVPIYSLENNSQEATVTNSPHPFNDDDVVSIFGATGQSPERWNGTFVIYGVNPQKTSFNYYMTGVPAGGGPGSSGITAARVSKFRFDMIMTGLSEKARVHLGPTPSGQPFLTRGYANGVAGGWQLKAGMRIRGAGTDATVVRLVPAASGNYHFYAFGHALTIGSPIQPNVLDFVEVSDLTVDCNSVITTAASVKVACGAIRLLGNHSRVSRIRVINWGGNKDLPCFAIALLTGDRTVALTEVEDCGIENCIVIQPATSPANAPVTALHIGGNAAVAAGAEAFGKGPFIRNCFVDCQWPTSLMSSRGLSMSWCRAGIVEGNQIHNTQIGGPRCESTSIKELVVRNNLYKNVAKAADFDLGQTWSNSMGTGSLTRSGSVGSVVISGHDLVVGDRVKLTTSVTSFDGIYRVTGVDGNTFFVTMSDSGPSSASVASAYRVFGVEKLIIETNIVELATGTNGQIAIQCTDNASTTPTPDFVYGDLIIRDNKVRYVDGLFDPAYLGYGIQVNGGKNIIVRSNLVESAVVNPIRYRRCSNTTYFNNRAPTGVLIEGFNPDTLQKPAELETDNDLALIISLFSRRAR